MMNKTMKTWLMGLLACFAFMSFTQASEGEDIEFSDAELAQILAPIALYPDTVLTHILIASTYPIEVVQAERWAHKHKDLNPEDAIDAVEDKDWDPSVKALVPFPNLLKQLSNELDWTQQIGDAFLQDEARVLDTIQSLRQKAYAAGNLQSNDQVEVERDEQQIIVIEPRESRVVYVPYYDTRVVYGDWHWAHYPPIYWRPWHSHHHHYSHGVYWGPRVRLSVGFFFGSFHWWDRHVVVIDHHHYRRHSFRASHSRGRHIAQHNSGRHWSHNPQHRRGVAYRTHKTSKKYHSKKQPRIVTQHKRARADESKSKTRVVSRHKINTIERHDKVKANLKTRRDYEQKRDTKSTHTTTSRDSKSRDSKSRDSKSRDSKSRDNKSRDKSDHDTKASTRTTSSKASSRHRSRSDNRTEKSRRSASSKKDRSTASSSRHDRKQSNTRRAKNKKD
jgi:hypothetical protein